MSSSAIVSNTLKARAAAEEARLNDLHRQLQKAILTAPIFLCSTHGVYDLDSTSPPCIVPENTFIFELQTVGDLTLTSIDKYIWNLLQGPYRDTFYYYLLGDENTFSNIHYEPKYTQALSNMTLYKPGDTLYKRNLSIGGGRTMALDESKRRNYGDMGFFRFDADKEAYPIKQYGSKMPYEILQRLHRELVGDERLETTDCDLVHSILFPSGSHTYLNGTRSEQMFETAWPANYPRGAPTIFVFSSCAAITNPTTPAHRTRWEQIASAQQQCNLDSMSMGLMALGSGGGESGIVNPPHSMNLRPKGRHPTSFLSSSRVTTSFSRPNTGTNKLMKLRRAKHRLRRTRRSSRRHRN
jgi:hypothetical protein